MPCSKKDYVAVAAIISERWKAANRSMTQPTSKCEAIEAVAFDLAHYFGSQSQAFDKVRFLKACGIPQDEPGGHCAECGECWPCSDSRRRDIHSHIVAKHRRAQ